MTKIQRNISIQILRGISILSVVLFHAFPSIFNSGYLGVDLFFIISGFVITPLINKILESNSKKSELKSFYIKRYWRLIPALTLTLIGTLITCFLFTGLGYMKNLFYSLLSTQLLIANYYSYKVTGDYFRPDPNPLIHTWSLSVEEQIYLLLPVVFIILTNVVKNSLKIQYFYVLLGLASFIFYLNSWPKNEIFSFYSFHTRFWEFSIGALLYFFNYKFPSKNSITKNYHLLLFTLLIILILFGPNNFIYIAALIILFRNFIFFGLDKVLPNFIIRPLVNLGDRSYSLYLVHMPAIWLIKQFSDLLNLDNLQQIISKVMGMVMIYLIGDTLYLLVEKRFRDADYRTKTKKSSFIKIQVFLLIITLVGIGAGSNNYYLTNSVLTRPSTDMDSVAKDDCKIMVSDTGCRYISSASNNKYLFIGDSHAGALSKTIRKIFIEKGTLDIYLKTGCQFIYSELIANKAFEQNKDCQLYINKVGTKIKANNYKAIIVKYISTVDKSSLKSHDYDLLFKYKLSSLKILQNRCNCKIVLLGPTPLFPVDNNFFSPGRKIIKGNETPAHQVKITEMNQVPFKENTFWSKNLPSDNIMTISLINEFCDLDKCSRWSNGWLFADYSHLSSLGSYYLKSIIWTAMDDAKI